MARPTTPAGFGRSFNPARFREAIRATMIMGTPNAVEDRATFEWDVERTFEVADARSNPYSWDADPETEESTEPVQVPVVVDFASSYGVSGGTSMADFDATRATVMLLDEDYAKVVGAKRILLGGATYDIDYWAPPQGLFEVTIHTAYCTARDEH